MKFYHASMHVQFDKPMATLLHVPPRRLESLLPNKNKINRRWLPLNALRAFEAVGQRLSFTGGAHLLSISQSAVSRHVIGVEELLGKALFVRQSNGLTLTPEGEALLPVVSKCFDRIEQAMNTIRDGTQTNRALRLHIPPSLLQKIFLPILAEFRHLHPDIRLDISSSYVTGLPPEHLDMAIVYDQPHVDNQVTDLLWMVRVAPLCAPSIAKAAKNTDMCSFLSAHELLHVKLEHQPRNHLWSAYAHQNKLDIATQSGLSFDTAIAAGDYAVAGEGVILGDINLFTHEIASGKLVMPYDQICEDGYGYFLKFHPDDLADPMIATFRSWLIAKFAQNEEIAHPA